MINWETTFITAYVRKGKYRLEVWQGYDGAWRASVSYRHQLTGLQGKKEWKTMLQAKRYALKLLKVYRKTKRVTGS